MKKFSLIVFVVILLTVETNLGQIFSQNFNSSTVLTDYYNTTPGSNQFRKIDTTNANSTVSVASNSLVLSKNADATTQAYAERNVDFSSIPTAVYLQFTFSVSGTYSSSATNAISFYFGTNVANASAVPSLSNVYARFFINLNNNVGQFQIKDISNNDTGVNWFSGTQTITWVLNNSGSSKTYLAPNGSSETIGDDKVDIWVGTTKEFDDKSVETSTATLARFKILTSGWVNGTTFTIDDIVISNETALPVQLTTFTALLTDGNVQLNWATATEINNYGFDIERASASLGMTWEKIAFIQGHGNSNSTKNYSYIDNAAPAGKVRYRLKQIDFDGKFEYSDVAEVNVETPTKLVLYQNIPNPFNPTTEIKFALPNKSNIELSIYNLLGEKIRTLINETMPSGNHKIFFNAADLASGVYLYVLIAEKSSTIKKMILIK